MEKMKQECKVKKSLKIWQGVLTLLVSAVILFVAAPILLSPFGMYGSLLGELLLFGVAVGAVLLFQGDLREVFPLKKPHFSGIAGTILIWVGTFLCEMVLLLILSLFFPEQILEVNDGLSSSIAAGPFLLSFVTVAISPAICEEALFRGTFVSSLRGRLGKWAVLLISGCIFRDIPRRCFSIFSDGDRWGDDGISVVGNRKYVL
jgi:CAAX amino terminal protease family.